MSEEEAYRTVLATLKEEAIYPYTEDEIQVVKSVESCINCGLCIQHCPVVAAVGLDRFSGPRSIAVELSRSPPEYWTTADVVYLCTGCGTCREVCPKDVDIPEIVNLIRARIFKHRPDLVPIQLHTADAILVEHGLAFVPWEDPEEKVESRNMRLERLGLRYVPDQVVKGADVLFYPGCQAEERAQEVKESAKIILAHFKAKFTLLEGMNCCGLPATLLGDDETALELALKLKKKVKDLGVKMVVTTCAGCTSNLARIAERDAWGIPVYHMLEYLVEVIGIAKLSSTFKQSTEEEPLRVTLHDPCHLIKHTSRITMDYAIQILSLIPDVEVAQSFAHDSCCGGGGLVSYHAGDVARAVMKENLAAIEETGAARVVTPCPLCTAQLEDSLFRQGSSVEVDDMTVFIAQRLPQEG